VFGFCGVNYEIDLSDENEACTIVHRPFANTLFDRVDAGQSRNAAPFCAQRLDHGSVNSHRGRQRDPGDDPVPAGAT
jgi:hypothetical protein